jgi:hypothetical protein
MNLLKDFFSIPSSIDQEAILQFFNCNDPNVFEGGEFLNLAPLSTEVSIETLKIVVRDLLERYQGGLGLIDIENIIFFITFIRFLTLAIKYNIKTSFYISCISVIAGLMWYIHLKDLRRFYGPMLGYNRFTQAFVNDMNNQAYLKAGAKRYVSNPTTLRWINNSPLRFLKSAFVYSIERDGYRIDPISMLVSKLPDEYKSQVAPIYYKIYENFLPKIWKNGFRLVKQIFPLLVYSNIVRVNKKYCPYLIRWHWTFIVMSGVVEGEVARVMYRLYTYIHRVLIPAGRFTEAGFLQTIFTVVIGAQFCYIFLAMLHAVCGQYFYLPFMTENVEIHIGKRPQNSIYSGGYTSWQEGSVTRMEYRIYNDVKFEFPRIWWGWLGKRPTFENVKERKYRENRKNKIRKRRNKRIRKFVRRLKNWISRS